MVRCSAGAIATALGLPRCAGTSDTAEISADITLSRTGRSIRLTQADGVAVAATPNPALIGLLIKARRWWTTLRQVG